MKYGFVRHRYEHAIVIEVDPADLAGVEEHNREFASKDPLLPNVKAGVTKYARISKTHLIRGGDAFV